MPTAIGSTTMSINHILQYLPLHERMSKSFMAVIIPPKTPDGVYIEVPRTEAPHKNQKQRTRQTRKDMIENKRCKKIAKKQKQRNSAKSEIRERRVTRSQAKANATAKSESSMGVGNERWCGKPGGSLG